MTLSGEVLQGCFFGEPWDGQITNDAVHHCGVDCRWEAEARTCSPCDAEPRTEPADAQELCVGAAEFLKGCDERTYLSSGIERVRSCWPKHAVYTTPFFADATPVTVRRYQECVNDGACTDLEPFVNQWRQGGAMREVRIDDTAFDDDAVLVWTATWEQANQFCTWAFMPR
ncbi:MAG: hypothetical protein AAF411_17915 [Myxococcota bacterium]